MNPNTFRIVPGAGINATDLIALADVKEFLRVDHDAEDDLIAALLSAAIADAENMTGRILGLQILTAVADDWESQIFAFGPIAQISAVEYYDGQNQLQTLDASRYWFDIQTTPGRITFLSPPSVYSDRHNAVQIRASVGHGTLPPAIRQAVLLTVGHYYENRQTVTVGAAPHEVPMAVRHLLNPYRLFR